MGVTAEPCPVGDEEKFAAVTAVTSEPGDTLAQRRADALLTLAETLLKHGPCGLTTAERYQVALHVTAETLAGERDGRCELDNGQRLPLDTARRIACDSAVVRIVEGPDGNPLDIGRKTRAVPPSLRRALRARDAGCRFPGCSCRRFVDAHHIVHWADGGDTSLANLVLLCRRHHRLVHEGGFTVARAAGGEIRFTRPDGRSIDPHPRPPCAGSVAALRRGNRAGGRAIDASAWILAGDKLDYGIAIEGLLRTADGRACRDDGSQ